MISIVDCDVQHLVNLNMIRPQVSWERPSSYNINANVIALYSFDHVTKANFAISFQLNFALEQ